MTKKKKQEQAPEAQAPEVEQQQPEPAPIVQAAPPLSHFQTPHDIGSLRALAKILGASGYFKDVRGEAQALTKIVAGAEIGLGPVTSLTAIYIVEGKPSFSSNLVGSQIKRSGRYNYKLDTLNDKLCMINFYENGELIGVSSFDWEDATLAGLTNRHNWKQHPRNMLFARALTNGARWFTPDVFTFPVYTPDELDPDIQLDESGEVVEGQFTEPPTREEEFHGEPGRVDNQWEQELRDAIKKHELMQINHAVSVLNLSPFVRVPYGELDTAEGVAYIMAWVKIKEDSPKLPTDERAKMVDAIYKKFIPKAEELLAEGA